LYRHQLPKIHHQATSSVIPPAAYQMSVRSVEWHHTP